MTELAKAIIGSGSRFSVCDKTHYRIGGCYTGDKDLNLQYEPPVCDLKQAGSPACENDSLFCQESAQHLFSIRKSQNIANHIVVGEILRAIDCRLAEILFATGVYPEKYWVDRDKNFGFSSKLCFAKDILPREITMNTLSRNLADLRNRAEHRFEEPNNQETQSSLEIMNAFFQLTKGLLDILGEVSAFWYPVKNMNKPVVIQIMREQGTLLLINDGDIPDTKSGLPADKKPAKNLIKKVVTDILWYSDNDPSFISNLGF